MAAPYVISSGQQIMIREREAHQNNHIIGAILGGSFSGTWNWKKCGSLRSVAILEVKETSVNTGSARGCASLRDFAQNAKNESSPTTLALSAPPSFTHDERSECERGGPIGAMNVQENWPSASAQKTSSTRGAQRRSA